MWSPNVQSTVCILDRANIVLLYNDEKWKALYRNNMLYLIMYALFWTGRLKCSNSNSRKVQCVFNLGWVSGLFQRLELSFSSNSILDFIPCGSAPSQFIHNIDKMPTAPQWIQNSIWAADKSWKWHFSEKWINLVIFQPPPHSEVN